MNKYEGTLSYERETLRLLEQAHAILELVTEYRTLHWEPEWIAEEPPHMTIGQGELLHWIVKQKAVVQGLEQELLEEAKDDRTPDR